MIIEKIKQETGIDVTLKSRKREQVEMKTLASFLFRQKGYSLTQIGKELNLNHATIIHHLKIYETVKHYNPKIQELENTIIGNKPDLVVESLQLTNKLKDIEIAELKKQIEQLKKQHTNQTINRLIPLLEHEDIKEKFEAFLNINEKAKYYKKYE
jgi:GTPase involved in cell partitioning and DNA repair